jgi:hypothetical protein
VCFVEPKRHLLGYVIHDSLRAPRSDDPELASYLRIEKRELEQGGLN